MAAVDVPAGTQENDLLIATCWSNATNGVWSAPAGWTILAQHQESSWDLSTAIMYKFAAASETTYTFSCSASGNMMASIVGYRGVDTGSPINVSGTYNFCSTSNWVAPSLTTTVDNALVVDVAFSSLAIFSHDSFSTPAGENQRIREDVNIDTRAEGTTMFDKVFATAGATGTRTATGGTSSECHQTYSFALTPGPVPQPIAGSSTGVGSASMTLTWPHQDVPCSPSAAAASASLALTAPAVLALAGSRAAATGALGLTVPTYVSLSPAVAVGEGNLWLGIVLDPRVSSTFKARWASGQHIGAAKPQMRAGIRTGRFNRGYKFWPWADDPPATIGQSDPGKPWQATWTPDTLDYLPVPNVLDCSQSKGTDSNGIESTTITIENIGYLEVDDPEGGPLKGHASRRGQMAPLRGYVAPDRTPLVDEAGDVVGPDPVWAGKFSRHAQITVWESYGDAEVKVFTGLIDDVDATSRPDQIVIVARDFGQVLSDERVFGWNKDPDIKDPIVFIDRDQADNISLVGDTSTASSEQTDHPAVNVEDGDSSTSWLGDPVDTAAYTDWVEVELPQSRYDDYVLWPAFAGMDVYVSLYATQWLDDAGVLQSPTRDGADIAEGWVDVGAGDVPGANGGIPYLELAAGASGTRLVRPLGSTFVTGDGTKLRVSYRTLGSVGGGHYAAGAIELQGRARSILTEARKQKWILVDDVSDVVKVILRWAGFKEWDVESTGVKLQKRLTIGRDKFYRDVIKLCEDATGYTFFMADPTNAPESIGIPTFRKSRIVLSQASLDDLAAAGEPAQPIITVTDQQLLGEIKVHQTNEPLAYIIRVRGRESKNGQRLGSYPDRRIMFTYRPPWSGTPMAGVIKHIVHTNHLFKRMDDCRFGAYYIALQQAIAANQATIEFPGYPGVDLDDHIELMDLGTGLTTRLLVLKRDTTFHAGEQTKWVTTVQGVLVDVPDIQDVVATIEAAVR